LTISGFITGYDIGVVSVVALYLFDDGIKGISSSDSKTSLFISIGSLGAAFGAFISGNLMDKYGRKKIILISDVLYFLGGLMMVIAPGMNILIFSRVLIGVATGITSLNVPIYISEVCPTEMRGRVVAIYTFLVVFGTFLANVIILFMPFKGYDWRILESVALVIVVAQFLGVYYLPDSPRWLANNGKQDEANACIY
jgi:MFS family permease